MKHRQACVKRRADFTPFIVSTDRVIQREGQHFLKHLAARLAMKWSKPYIDVMHFIRVRLSISTLRATVHCIWEARQKLAGLHFKDGAVLSLLSLWCLWCCVQLMSLFCYIVIYCTSYSLYPLSCTVYFATYCSLFSSFAVCLLLFLSVISTCRKDASLVV